jgi:hypothetical protein
VNLSVRSISIAHHTPVGNVSFSGCEPFGVVRAVGQNPDTSNAENDCQEAFKDEKDLPILDARVADVRNAVCYPAAKGAGEWSCGQVDADTFAPFLLSSTSGTWAKKVDHGKPGLTARG